MMSILLSVVAVGATPVLTSKQILSQCDMDIQEGRRFGGETLGFVTPWHPAGKDVAVKISKKLDYVSPFWFHIRPEQVGSDLSQWTVIVEPVTETAPDINWVHTMQASGTKVVPVFAFYGWQRSAMKQFFMHPDSGAIQHNVVRQMIAQCKKYNCDGLMLEWGALPVKEFYYELSPWLQRIKGSMAKFFTKPASLMLSVHPDPDKFGREEFEALAPVINKFVLHLYNFTSPVLDEGPAAPMEWFVDMIKAWQLDTRRDADSLVIITLNTYGREYRTGHGFDAEGYELAQGEPTDEAGRPTRWDVTGEQYTTILNTTDVTHQWDPLHQEHHVSFTTLEGEDHTVYYPSLRSIKARLDHVSKGTSKMGIGLWNLGTGLDYFYNLL
eukprot:TRINITY_DN7246_c0_g1_i1.p1 TRINITY_DN7246_c0_g1~~TRINITY_DN7246_c0_g1_i1.p1  ORF type:complete len:383 (+),score=51.96 TRINITY_DN7246_c0_g1_i1:52-1200(+)